MISWMTNIDDEMAYDKDCKKCIDRTLNTVHGKATPCIEHELAYANQEVAVIDCHFLDGENPKLGEDYVNNLIIDPTQTMEFLLDHIDAEAFEGRDTVLQLKLKKMTRNELNTLQEWEP